MLPSCRRALLSFVLLLITIAVAGCGAGKPAPTPTPTATATATPTATPTPTPTSTPTPTATDTPIPPTPDLRPQATVVGHGDRSRMAVSLTFDAGSDAGYTRQILDTLSANGIVAAFGMTGQFAERYPELLGRIVNEGHILINHSYDHASFTGASNRRATALTREERWQELDRTEAIIQQIGGSTTLPYFRPPYGDFNASVNADVFARGYRYNIMWSVDSQGWMGHSADEIVQHCLASAAPGAIYIFHVGSASQDAAALQRIIDGLRAQGYGFAPITDAAPR